jgi:E3 Ubiquitin ligase
LLAFALLWIYRSSSPAGFLGWDLFGLGAGVYLSVRGFQLLQRRRLILDTPFSKIRSASMGTVEVNGLAIGPYTIVSPISQHACYFYRTQAWEWKQSGKNKQWVQVADEAVHVPFFVDDNSGRVLVDPRGAELDLHCDFKQEFSDSIFSSKDPVPPNVHAFLSLHGIVTSNKIKVEECCIKPKNSLFILGTLAENPGLSVTPEVFSENEMTASQTRRVSFGSRGFSISATNIGGEAHAVSTTIRIGSPSTVAFPEASESVRHSSASAATVTAVAKSTEMSQQQRIAAALAKAGISNPAALKVAGLLRSEPEVTTDPSLMSTLSAAKKLIAGDAGASDDFDSHPATVLMKGTNNKAFMISWRSQQDVARSLGWKCTAMIWGGGVLTLLSIYILVNIIELL